MDTSKTAKRTVPVWTQQRSVDARLRETRVAVDPLVRFTDYYAGSTGSTCMLYGVYVWHVENSTDCWDGAYHTVGHTRYCTNCLLRLCWKNSVLKQEWCGLLLCFKCDLLKDVREGKENGAERLQIRDKQQTTLWIEDHIRFPCPSNRSTRASIATNTTVHIYKYIVLQCPFFLLSVSPSLIHQGVRTKTVKKSARTIVEKYYTRLTLDFHTNKRVIDEVAILPSKRMRNKIAGYTTHLMRRIAKGPVRGISLKLQEEERERRLDFVPEVSALEQETIQIDPDTRDLLESLGFGSLHGVAVNQPRD